MITYAQKEGVDSEVTVVGLRLLISLKSIDNDNDNDRKDKKDYDYIHCLIIISLFRLSRY